MADCRAEYGSARFEAIRARAEKDAVLLCEAVKDKAANPPEAGAPRTFTLGEALRRIAGIRVGTWQSKPVWHQVSAVHERLLRNERHSAVGVDAGFLAYFGTWLQWFAWGTGALDYADIVVRRGGMGSRDIAASIAETLWRISRRRGGGQLNEMDSAGRSDG